MISDVFISEIDTKYSDYDCKFLIIDSDKFESRTSLNNSDFTIA